MIQSHYIIQYTSKFGNPVTINTLKDNITGFEYEFDTKEEAEIMLNKLATGGKINLSSYTYELVRVDVTTTEEVVGNFGYEKSPIKFISTL